MEIINYANRSKIKIKNAGFTDYLQTTKILPKFKYGWDNKVYEHNTLGDSCIGYIDGYQIDGDLLFMSSWGEGMSIHKLNDDGSLTLLWQHNDPCAPHSTYSYMTTIAIHKPTKKLVVTTYGSSTYAIYDYSDIYNGNLTQLENGPYIFTNGVNIGNTGDSYNCACSIAGDWLYLGEHDAVHYKKFPRRNMVDGRQELLDGTDRLIKYGYRPMISYDDVNDRIYYFFYYNGTFTVILNASTETPEIFECDLSKLTGSDDSYEKVFFVPNPVGEPNILYCDTSDRVLKVDITPCLETLNAAPFLLENRWIREPEIGESNGGNEVRMGTKTFSNIGDIQDRMPGHFSDFIPISANGGRNMLRGWWDIENHRPVGFYRHDYLVEDLSVVGRSIRCDYSHPLFLMSSANGTKYWLSLGYGYDGHRILTWNESVGNGMFENWEMTYGPIKPSTGKKINVIQSTGDKFIIPSGCSFSSFYSLDNENWISYDFQNKEQLVFSNGINQIYFKFVATGFGHKNVYYSSDKFIAFTYIEFLQEELPSSNIRNLISRRKRR